jgi:hypothetical protein
MLRRTISKDGFTLIPLGGNNLGKYAIVDNDEVWVEQHAWWLDRHGHVMTTIGHKNKSLHRLIAKTPEDLATDHINGDKLDNRKGNLRACINRDNLLNRGPQKNNKSGYKGVSWNKPLSKWVAQISINRKQRYLGLFTDIEEAAKAYDKAAKENHGDFARLNYGA